MFSTTEGDHRNAFEKLKKSLKIKQALYTDPKEPDLLKTVFKLKEVGAKLGVDPNLSYVPQEQLKRAPSTVNSGTQAQVQVALC